MISLLIHDTLPHATYQRRRGECAGLAKCEVAWVVMHGNAQAACPAECEGFQRVGEMPSTPPPPVVPPPPASTKRAIRNHPPVRINGAEVVARRREGEKVPQLALRFGVSQLWIYRLLRAGGYKSTRGCRAREHGP